MSKNKSVSMQAGRSWSDIAVDGIWPGLAGGVVMIAYLLAAGLLQGVPPLETFSYFLPDASWPDLAGLGSHLAVSVVYGSIFGLLMAAFGRYLPQRLPVWTAGIAYALALWLLAALVILPADVSGLGTIPAVHFLAAHLLYGWAAGRLLASSHAQQG